MSPIPGTFRVIIVGAGFGGLGVGAALLRSGIEDFVILERAEEIGGTWRDNTYPGATCDVPSNLYSFSFAPNPSWSRSFSAQPEILDYLHHFVEGETLRPHLRLGHEVLSTSWDETTLSWTVTTNEGELHAQVLVSARGPLSEPALPDIPGLDTFTGAVFHSARWDHAHELKGKRVAVVGTGASAIQFVPQIQPEVGKLFVFQRTPPWVLPRRDRQLSRLEHEIYRRLPIAQRLVRGLVYWGRELYALGFAGRPRLRRRLMGAAELAARRHLERQVADPGLRKQLTPRYEMGCKRILISNDYYPALTQPNVELVSSTITEIGARSITTVDGQERPVDAIVFGTGFDVTGRAASDHTRGRDGRLLSEVWSDGPVAYRGTSIAGFPNLFLVIGPNTGLGHSSMIFVIESQIDYLLSCLRAMDSRGLAAVEVRQEAQDEWNDEVARKSDGTVWTSGCDSYYLDSKGRNIGIWPGSSWSLRQALGVFDPSAHHLTYSEPGAPRGTLAEAALSGTPSS